MSLSRRRVIQVSGLSLAATSSEGTGCRFTCCSICPSSAAIMPLTAFISDSAALTLGVFLWPARRYLGD